MSENDPLGLNEHSELKGLGPSWACAAFGTAGHDYYTCPDCKANYQAWLDNIFAAPANPVVPI